MTMNMLAGIKKLLCINADTGEPMPAPYDSIGCTDEEGRGTMRSILSRMWRWEPARAEDTMLETRHLTDRQAYRRARRLLLSGQAGQLSPVQASFAQRFGRYTPYVSILPETVLASSQFQEFASGFGANLDEVIRYPLWAIIDYTAAGNVQYSLYNQNTGSATYAFNGTNLKVGGQLPAHQYQIVTAHKVMVMQAIGDIGVAVAATGLTLVAPGELHRALFSPSRYEFFIAEKTYVNIGPIGSLPFGGGISAGGAVAGTYTATAGQGAVAAYNTGEPWRSVPPVGIPPSWTFGATCNWNAARALTTAGFLAGQLDGFQVRATQ